MSERRAKPKNAFTDAQIALLQRAMRDEGMEDVIDLGNALGVGRTVYRWFDQTRGASEEMKRRIAEVLKIPLAQLADPEGFKLAMGENVSGYVERAERPDSFRERDLYDGLGAAALIMGLPAPHAIGKELPPDRWEAEIGPNGIGFKVRGESMAGWPKRPIFDGDTAWCNPDDTTWKRGVVVAVVEEREGDEPRAIIKFHDGANGLWSYPAGGVREPVSIYRIHAMTPVIVLTSPPGEP